MKDLLKHPELLSALNECRPVSKFSGKPLTLVSNGYGLRLTWENSMERDWWVGAQDGVYTRQHRVTVTDEDIMTAAARCGIDSGEVATAFLSRIQEEAANQAENDRSNAARYAEDAATLEIKRAQYRAEFGSAHPELLDESASKAAADELAEIFRKFPEIACMTRKMMMVDSDGKQLAHFSNLSGMKAWLFQNGFRASIDDRHAFVIDARRNPKGAIVITELNKP